MKKMLMMAVVALSIMAIGQTQDLATTKPVQTPAAPSDIDGTWLGTLDTGPLKLRVAFHITNTGEGLKTTMDSLDQNARGLPVTTVTRKGSSLTLELKQIGGSFVGEISKDAASIQGTWTQGGASLPLLLNRVKDAAALQQARPQEPKKPYPYREEEVGYDNPAAGIKLAATLTLPPGKGPFPAVLLITGSGPQDRDESLMGHKPFLVLADYLTRKGIAVLRADDRGVGKSGGSFRMSTTADFASDAEAGVAFLKTRPEIDPHKIGLIGHSEGGVIAPMVAARNPGVAFIVLMAGTAVPGDEVLFEQVRMLSEAKGVDSEQTEKAVAQEHEVLAMVKKIKDDAELEKQLRQLLAGSMPEDRLSLQLKAIKTPWFRYFLDYDPATALRKVTCAVLAIDGSKDTQVSAKQNLPVIRKALEAAGNKDFETYEFPGLNHLFQTAKTGAPSEYGEIEETMSPVVLDKIAGWITAHAVSGTAAQAAR